MTARGSGTASARNQLKRLVKNAVLVLPGRTAALRGVVPCGVQLSEHKGETPYHQNVATYDGTKYVGYISHAFSLGGVIPVTFAAHRDGYSFAGMLTVCNSTWTCKNGQPRSYVVSVSGQLDISSEPDMLGYTYAIDLFCGGVLACAEKGTFNGKRWSGTASAAEGDFYGLHSWTVACCPKRHTL